MVERGLLWLGLTVALSAGVALGYALSTDNDTALWASVVALLAGALLVVSGIRAGQRPTQRRSLPRPVVVPPRESTSPRLGELLAKRGFISRAELEEALAQQRGTGRLLGQILVEMGAVTPALLAQVLEEQRSQQESGPS